MEKHWLENNETNDLLTKSVLQSEEILSWCHRSEVQNNEISVMLNYHPYQAFSISVSFCVQHYVENETHIINSVINLGRLNSKHVVSYLTNISCMYIRIWNHKFQRHQFKTFKQFKLPVFAMLFPTCPRLFSNSSILSVFNVIGIKGR